MQSPSFADGATTDGETHPRYRPDIDGLRAIAVASVVLFHAGLSFFPGGFVGVDLFFVISGYLIGGIVNRDISLGRFSFATFYARRAKRILPALIVVILCQSILALLTLSPDELSRFGTSAGSALLGASNIRFWMQDGYFAPDAHLDPLLMTWSLGVEEQFYLLLPPALLLIHRVAPRRAFGLVVVGSSLSLLLSMILTTRQPNTAFYLLPTRSWELGAGVALALWQRRAGPIVSPAVANLLSAAGLAAILVAITGFDEHTPFPGWAATLPVFGGAALLAAEVAWLNRRVLSSPPMRMLGLLSYSWYLWHWPLMAFARICCAGEPATATLVGLAVAALALAYLSWRFVERPFRRASARPNSHVLLAYGAVSGVCIAALLGFHLAKGLPSRLPPQAAIVRKALAEGHGSPCLDGYGDAELRRGVPCVTPGGGPRVALLGDSHANALADTLRTIAAEQGLGLTMFTKSSCPPLYGATRRMAAHPHHAEECGRYNRSAVDAVVADPSIRTVVLTAFWSIPFEVERPGDGYSATIPLPRGDGSQQALFRSALTDTLVRLQRAGKRVIVLGDAPRLRIDPAREIYALFLPTRAALQRLAGGPVPPATGMIDRAMIVPAAGGSAEIVADATRRDPGVVYRSLIDAMCTSSGCAIWSRDDQPYYVDTQHLSDPGARYALDRLGIASLLRAGEDRSQHGP